MKKIDLEQEYILAEDTIIFGALVTFKFSTCFPLNTDLVGLLLGLVLAAIIH